MRKFRSRGTLVGQDKVDNHDQLQSGVDGVCGEGGGLLHERIKVRIATGEKGGIMGIKRRPNTFHSNFSSSSIPIFSHPSFPHLPSYYIQPERKNPHILRHSGTFPSYCASIRVRDTSKRFTAPLPIVSSQPSLSHTALRLYLASTPDPAFVQDLVQSFKHSNMPSTQTLRAPSHPSLPLTMPGKSPYYSPPMAHQGPYARPVVSPPTPGSSVNTSAVPSLTSGSQSGEDNVPHGASNIDLVEMLNDRLSNAVDTLPLDRSLVRQAQT